MHRRAAESALLAATHGSTGLPEARATATPAARPTPQNQRTAISSWHFPNRPSKIRTRHQNIRRSAWPTPATLRGLSAWWKPYRPLRSATRCLIVKLPLERPPAPKSMRTWAFEHSAWRAHPASLAAARAIHPAATITQGRRPLRRCVASGKPSLRTLWMWVSPQLAALSASESQSDRTDPTWLVTVRKGCLL